MKVTLSIYLDADLFQIEEIGEVERLATETSSQVYTWKTIGRSNWLDRGASISDALGLVILPQGLPDYMELADDVPEGGEDEESESASE
jgi:hypothetical protein